MNIFSKQALGFRRLALAVCITSGLAACQQEGVLPSTASREVAFGDLPQGVQSFIGTHYDDSEVRVSYRHRQRGSDDVFEVELHWGTGLFFDDHGGLRGAWDDDNSSDDYLAPDQLPAAVQAWLDTHLPGATIREVEVNHHRDGSLSYEVELADGSEYYFDADGGFVFWTEDHSLRRGSSDHVPVSDLPQAIRDYVAATYPGATIVKAEINHHQDGSFRKYEIELSNGVELNFDEQGQYLPDDSGYSGSEDHIDIALSDLPQVTQDYLDQHHAGAEIKRVRKKVSANGSVRRYEVRLEDGRKLFFDASGAFLYAD
ncbi:MAG: hypothetical protein OHK0039_37070 [Bacteroidia bacterium]